MLADIGINEAAMFTLLIMTAGSLVKQWLDKRDTNAKLKDVPVIAEKMEVVAADVLKIEKATNSMKDALVKATGEAAGAKGEAKGRADKTAEIKAEEKKENETYHG